MINAFKTAATIAAITFLSQPTNAQSVESSPSSRNVISLNGQWEIGEGNMETPPDSFPSKIPVPGLVDMAQPPFADVGLDSPRREAFWYRRTFTLDSPVPAVAMLKIYKASYGSQVILNGHEFDESLSAFTPVLTDVRSVLRKGENTLLVRVGHHPNVIVPKRVPHGLEPEKIRFIPGIFDNVELILSGTPRITNIQVLPEIDSKTARIQTLLQNDTGAATQTKVSYTIREHKSGEVVGQASASVSLPASSDETTATITIPIENCRLWSPEDPFLYDVIVDCGTDQVTDRFGMRSFRLDHATGRPYLNGKPYYMRGSNITLYRFFEDSERGMLPWDKQWVRDLHRKARDMHWNSMRYCIGFPPDFWYDIADEEGILIQDEFPIWNSRNKKIPNDFNTDILASQFTDWMRDRWNHPSVVVWDAQNETHSTQTGVAIAAVRNKDLSNRPWDNGYARYRLKGDSYESHPYLYNKGRFELEDLAETPKTPLGNHGGPNVNDNPIILNEYGWIWLNRDGTVTRLSKPVYARLLKGRKITTAQRRHLHARLLAGLTEFWRSHRAYAAVMHFCYLGYSRPDGHTSDEFIDVKNLELEPEFVKYVSDAFAPVGIMIDFWASHTPPGETKDITVAVINDLDTPWNGQVRLSLLKNNSVVEESDQPCTVAPYGRQEIVFPVNFPAEEGDYQLRATLAAGDDKPVHSWRDVIVGPDDDTSTTPGLAVGKPAKASSVTSKGHFPPKFAFDGKPDTRWASEDTTPQWLMVDLEEPTTVSAVELVWENAYASSYYIETSLDGETWTKVYETSKGYPHEPLIRIDPVNARYVRVTATKLGTRWGASLWEMKIF